MSTIGPRIVNIRGEDFCVCIDYTVSAAAVVAIRIADGFIHAFAIDRHLTDDTAQAELDVIASDVEGDIFMLRYGSALHGDRCVARELLDKSL